MASIHVSDSSLKHAAAGPEGSFVDIGSERFYRVSNYDAMPPFFMSLVSDSDHWFFISSNGALTVGRKDPDHALFPYYTDDRIHDSQDQTGSKTLLRVVKDGKTYLWEPFSQRYDGLYKVTRNLYKSVYGNKVLFEEINEELGLTFRYEWMNSERFGFVRRASLINDGKGKISAELVDGIQNVLPYGVERRFQMEYSTLADGYKRTELVAGTALALFRLSSIPADKAEPSEALKVNAAWSTGLDGAKHLLSSAQFGAFRKGIAIQEETDVRGRRGAYLLNATVALEAGASKDWLIVAELNLDAAGVRALKKQLETTPAIGTEVLADVVKGTQNLVRIVAGADGLQITQDELSTWRHFSNTLFNAMRGGVPDDSYRISKADLKAFLAQSNKEVLARQASFLDALPDALPHGELMAKVAGVKDVDLDRLANEYLPLTFSRRHGDPSRPWNIFSIQVKDGEGRKILNYQGNWRDIFQNWEALGYSYPGFLESMIFKFVDSSTADGYNPYRVLREGYDWEVIDPHDTWSFIGYWGDHQVIYLLKLLETSNRYHPGSLAGLLGKRVFTYANVPYRIKSYEAMLANPRNTIVFDQEVHKQAMAKAATLGADGKALTGASGLSRASLTEKLLVVALSKLSNFIPEAGIWMNTQRPEWNDANNALVGYGVSMVTLYYLRRYLAFCKELFPSGGASFELSREVAVMLESIAGIFEKHAGLLGKPISDRDRKVVLDALGQAGSEYREQVYTRGFTGEVASVSTERLQAFCDIALKHIDHSIQANRRSDGLYHSYNLMKVVGHGVEVRYLYEMLEGQVAVLSSGALSAKEVADLLDALRKSDLYREDQASYILYPDRPLPHFLEKNNIPSEAVAKSELLKALLKAGDVRIVSKDIEGHAHFHASFRNAELLREALEGLKGGEFRALVEKEEQLVLDIYEQVFDHQSFTGRSGTFYKYEGLGCIYWHMVSKLLLAVDEVQKGAIHGDAQTLERLKKHYVEIREGIGVHKSPAAYGAIPTDPYSHTPGFAGVQQPGMTGQVKEDFISRFSEMGFQVAGGCISFEPKLVPASEFLAQAATFAYVDAAGQSKSIALEKDSLAYTVCQVPVVAHKAGAPRIVVTKADGSSLTVDALALDAATSAAIFDRTGTIVQLDVFLGLNG